MDGAEAYRWLIAGAAPVTDPFDVHVLASVLAVAVAEGGAAGDVCARAGLGRAGLGMLASEVFPGCRAELDRLGAEEPPDPEVEQASLHALLMAHAVGRSPLEAPLAAMIARRAMEPDHLWQDLGLRDRGELSTLLGRHFAPLARQNRDGMKWKRFFYRKLCEAEGFVLCTAPSCSACDEFETCFGAETGEARLARGRNGVAAPRPV